MSIRKISFAVDEYYHIYNRGNSKQKIFLNKGDYFHFLKLLYLCNSKRNFVIRDIVEDEYDFDREESFVYIGTFCLMPNHFHLLIKEKEEDGISKFMQKFSTAYVMYFNTIHKRTGSLFEGKFKAEHLYNDRYLKYVFSYMHLNPVKLIDKDWKEIGIKNVKETKKYLAEYKYSSYPEYLGEHRLQSKILSIEKFPDYFPNKNEFEREILDWITYNPRGKASEVFKKEIKNAYFK
ncbi:MAG: transposase [Candidatus Paceibacterota bacterium]|jgi:putative transposase